MMTELQIFVCIIVLNTIVVLLYLLWGLLLQPIRRARQEKNSPMLSKTGYLFKGIIMLLCPGVGVLFFLLSELLFLLLFRSQVDLEDVIFGKDKVIAQRKADEEHERNRVPLEEALAVSDKNSQRDLMMDVVRGDVKNLLASISQALNSEDSETAHYAATALGDELNTFRQKTQEIYNSIKEGGPQAAEDSCMLIEYMNGVLAQNVYTDMEQNAFVDMMEGACEYLYCNIGERKRLLSEYMEWMALQLLNIKEYDRMQKWCDRLMEMYPMELASYTVQLKLYFSIQDKKRFFDTLNKLKQSDIVIDRDTLDLIRVFS